MTRKQDKSQEPTSSRASVGFGAAGFVRRRAMASTVAVLLLLSAGLFTVTVGFVDDNDCLGYFTSKHEYMPSMSCSNGFVSHHCCGDCDNRYCCFFGYLKLSTEEQLACTVQNSDVLIIVSGVMGLLITCIVFIVCCCCPCCFMYKMCRTPRPVVGGTHITTVMSTQCIQQQQQQQQPVMQPAQYPAYQLVPTQPGYGAQPMQTGPYQGQPYAPGPQLSYNMAANPGYPSVQAPYDGSQATYPMMPPAQPGSAYPPPAQPGSAYPPQESFDQPAYNPAYMQPPNTGY